MTALERAALDRRLVAIEAEIRRIKAIQSKTTTAIADDGTVAATDPTASCGFYAAPQLIDQSATINDYRAWTTATMPAPCPATASGIVLQWTMSEDGSDLGERRMDLSIDGGMSVFLIGYGNITRADADFGQGTTSGPYPCRVNGDAVEFDYQVIGPAAPEGLMAWSLYAVGWIV